jgi:uncharacterized protein involved in exopolysaccharide biosynthesis
MIDETPHAATEAGSDEEGSGGVNIDQIREIAGFVLRAPRRRPKLVLCVFLLVATLGVLIGLAMPKTYNSQVKLLAQRSAIRAIAGQTNGVEDNPTKNVSDMIMRRDNLVALAKEANLVNRNAESRSKILKFKDRVMEKLFGAPSEADLLDGMVATLALKLEVKVTEDSEVVISIDWSDPKLAYDLVTLVQKNFLEARYDSDVAVINDSIQVLEEHAKSELARVDKELDDYAKIVATRAPKTPPPAAAPVVVPAAGGRTIVIRPAATGAAPPAAIVDPELAKELEDKRAQMRALEEARQRMLDNLNQQLAQAQLTLTPMHPTVIGLQQQIAQLQEPSPELLQLRSEVRALMAQIAGPLTAANAAPAPTAATSIVRMLPPPRPLMAAATEDAGSAASADPIMIAPANTDRDGPLQLAQSELELAIRSYEDALMRLDASKVELDITGAAYKHRYTVVTPAELPRAPKKSLGRIIEVASVVGGLLLALLFATGLDILGGVILETWQVRRRLKLDLLSELENPS